MHEWSASRNPIMLGHTLQGAGIGLMVEFHKKPATNCWSSFSPFKSSWSLGPNTKTSAFGWHPVHVTAVYCLWLEELDKCQNQRHLLCGYRWFSWGMAYYVIPLPEGKGGSACGLPAVRLRAKNAGNTEEALHRHLTSSCK